MANVPLNWKDMAEHLTYQVCSNEISIEKSLQEVKQLNFQEQLDKEAISHAITDLMWDSFRAPNREIFVKAQLFYEAVKHKYISSGRKAFSNCFVAFYGYVLAGLFHKNKDFNRAKEIYERHLSDFNDILNMETRPNQEIHPIRDFLLPALNNLSLICMDLLEKDNALKYCNRAIDIASKNNFLWHLATAYNNIGLIQMNSGRGQEAIQKFELALDTLRNYLTTEDNTISGMSRRMFDAKDAEGRFIGNLASAFYNLGEFDKAEKQFIRAIEIADETKDKQGKADRLGNLALLMADKGLSNINNSNINEGTKCLETAITYYNETISLSKIIGDDKGMEISIGNRGLAYGRLGRYKEALNDFEEALELSRSLEHKIGEANWLNMAGQMLFTMEKYEQGISDIQKALRISKEIGFTRGIEACLGFLVYAYKEIGNNNLAQKYKSELATL